MKKIISFSLWGSVPKYTIGALKNVQLAEKLYPGWICRFYVGSSTPADISNALLRHANVELVRFNVPGDWKATVWRFLAAADNTVEVMISRDTDSRLTERERAAVDDWLASGKQFHIMRDHPLHSQWPIQGGMWGVRGGLLRNMENLLEANYWHSFNENQWGVDLKFLATTVHRLVSSRALVHDEISPMLAWDMLSERRRFPTPRTNHDFVGQVFDEQDRTVSEHVDALISRLESSSDAPGSGTDGAD